MCQADDGIGDLGVVAIGQDIVHETLVDLERVDRHAFQLAQVGMSGAEIVDVDMQAALAQGIEHVEGTRRILHRRALGHFQLQMR